MPAPIEEYIPQNAAARMRRRAFFVWGGSTFLIAVWVLLIALAPVAAANDLSELSNSLYGFFGYLCHQMPERSFDIQGQALAVCSRCFGIYLGLLLGLMIYPFLRTVGETEPPPRFWLFLALIPMAIDWLLGVFGIWENTHISRFVTGALVGAACAVFILPALIEIFQLLSGRKEKRLSA